MSVIKLMESGIIKLVDFKEKIMNRAQYDDVYFEWEEDKVFIDFLDYEDEECFARILKRLHY